MIITATLMTVAKIESRMMNRENDFCWLKAILFAMKEAMFTIKGYSGPVVVNAVLLSGVLILSKIKPGS
jgi:hypothetical protein